jgi:hypothetical protein
VKNIFLNVALVQCPPTSFFVFRMNGEKYKIKSNAPTMCIRVDNSSAQVRSPHYTPSTTALILAIKNKKPEIVRKLLAQDEINVELRDEHGSYPVIEIIKTFGEDTFDLVETVVSKASKHHISSAEDPYKAHAIDVADRLRLTKVVDLIENKVGKKKKKKKVCSKVPSV